MPFVKLEPTEHTLPNAQATLPGPSATPGRVKPETRDTPLPTPRAGTASPRKPLQHSSSFSNLKFTKPASQSFINAPAAYAKYSSPAEIDYTPENALCEGLSMVKLIDQNVKRLELGSRMRKDVWIRELNSLKGQGAPATMIAVCGATGAGKSSILNAILDDNIVPTSGMRACTATVTEIAYHAKPIIEADISFLSEEEWRAELDVLLHDLIDEDGNVKRVTNLNSDAGIAWSKVHAVYPSIGQEQISSMTVDQIINRDPRVRQKLGTVTKISAKDSKSFAKEVGKYVDSKDPKRTVGKKKDREQKEAEKRRAAGEMTLDEILGKKRKDKKDGLEGPAFWPLIRLVNVRCNAKALETGAVLVDLPGVADANAARNSIAKDYMKKCNCIWILAPITRAVDDKTAKDLLGDAFKTQLMMDGNYDAHIITFIASKCDDISCSEVIGALGLDDDPALEAIEERIEECSDKVAELKPQQRTATQNLSQIEARLKEVRKIKEEYKAHLEALEDGRSFTPKLTGKAAKKKAKAKASLKRKASGERKGSSKRGKPSSDSGEDDSTNDSDVDSFIVSDDQDSDIDELEDSDQEKSSDEEDENSTNEEGEDEDDDEDEVTEESLKEKIEEQQQLIKTLREPMHDLKLRKKEAADGIASWTKRKEKAQRDKNAFCSRKRSEFSRSVLKEDFRQGLKELDDAAAEKNDPDNFNPSVNLRDYAAIDLPVFTCSSRDYVRLKGQVKGDGEPSCFTNVEDTGVPALQKWCHQLTVSSRERAARSFFTNLRTFAASVRQYIDNANEITERDRALLKEKWCSGDLDDGNEHADYNDDDGYHYNGGIFHGGGSTSLDDELMRIITGHGAFSMHTRPPKVDAFGNPVGIVPRLTKEFKAIVDTAVVELKAEFKDGLQEKCETGAALAADAAVTTSDTFSAGMHWATYRATLRRHGSFRQDLNVELISPMTKNIASSWAKVFEADLFASFQTQIIDKVNKLTKEVEESAASALLDRVKSQADMCLEEAKLALKNTIEIVQETLNDEQKEISRCLAPHVQLQLIDGYDRAMEERGTGSVARQKAVFHNYVDRERDDVFQGGADIVMERLSTAAESVGAALNLRLRDLAEKVEVSIAALWEGVKDDPKQHRIRDEVVKLASDIISQIDLWSLARETREREAADEARAVEDELMEE